MNRQSDCSAAAIPSSPTGDQAFEARRLDSLRQLAVLDTGREAVFDRLASMAATQLGAAFVGISLVDEDRLWFKATVGSSLTEAARSGSVCDLVVAAGRFVEVTDAFTDPRFSESLMAAAGLRWYAGAPIFGIDGLPVGTLCVLDLHPRKLDEAGRLALEQLADLVTGQLHLAYRRAQNQVRTRQDHARLDLRRGLDAGEVLPFFQPIVALADTSVVGCEALARWQHPSRGLLLPGAFLDTAEQDDLILDLDLSMLAQSCRLLGEWHHDEALGLKPSVSINVSSRHLNNTYLFPRVCAALERHGLEGESLTLELTETVLATADPEAVKILTRLRDAGVSLALDDFGTAYSSLTYLQRFPVSSLKIDRSFVAGLAPGSRDQHLVDAILHLARSLGLDAVAEGVETAEQADLLRELGCPKAQGYLFSRPLAAAGMRTHLEGVAGRRPR